MKINCLITDIIDKTGNKVINKKTAYEYPIFTRQNAKFHNFSKEENNTLCSGFMNFL